MKPVYLPERFIGLSAAQKLIWFYVRDLGAAEYSSRSVAQALELSPHTAATALRVLKKRALLRELTPASGQRGATLEAR